MDLEIVEIEKYKLIKIRYNYKIDRLVIDNIINKSKQLLDKLNSKAPNGIVRNSAHKENMIVGGLLAEHSIHFCLNEISKTKKIDLKILNSTFDEDNNSVLGNQTDLSISVNGIIKTIEVQSSFCYKYYTTLGRLIGFPLKNGKSAYSIIGWYSASYKKLEIHKDYYLFIIHYYNPEDLKIKIYDFLDVYIVGGASKKTLEEKGYDTNLGQNGAKYRVINPINGVKDCLDVINEILQ